MAVTDQKAREVLAELIRLRPIGFTSVQSLSAKTFRSPQDISRIIHVLRSYGYGIKYQSGKGFRLDAISEQPVPWELQSKLHTKVLGRQRVILRKTLHSTQKTALLMAQQNRHAQGTVVIARRQTQSTGRLGRKWSSPEGGLWMSLVLCPKISPSRVTLLPMAVANAVCSAIESVSELKPHVKWPNDILICNRKVAGILIDSAVEGERLSYVVIGIGINVNFPASSLFSKPAKSFKVQPTSLLDEAGRRFSLLEIAAKLIDELEYEITMLEKGAIGGRGDEKVIDSWIKHTRMIGLKVVIDNGTNKCSGIVCGLSRSGGLILDTGHGELVEIVSGSVEKELPS